MSSYPKKILHWLDNQEVESVSGQYFDKINPADGQVVSQIARGDQPDVKKAIDSAVVAFSRWSTTPIIKRADLIRAATQIIQQRQEELSRYSALESGRSVKDTRGELAAVVEMGFFVAGEGRRYYGRTTTSAVENRTAFTIRQPVGVCALITPANNPLAGIAWKAFPALLAGNTVVTKPSATTPYMNIALAKIFQEVGLPAGVFSVVQGLAGEVGDPLVTDARIDLVSFTGSVPVGKRIEKLASDHLAKVSLELGGKNALVVCDDADLEAAAESAILSAFSSAGQRCAAGSRIIVFDSVYDQFKDRMIEKTKKLKLGISDDDDYGPIVSEKQLKSMVQSVDQAVVSGAKLVTGGKRLTDGKHKFGYYFEPTILEDIAPAAELSCQELFGPITILYRVKDFTEALNLTNNSPYGLTAAIHTGSIHRAQVFQERCRTGVVSVNGPTYGSEPQLPFGGLKQSGNGWREAGTEALDVFSDWKTIYIKHDPKKV